MAETVVTKANLNVRALPSLTGEKIWLAKNGTVFATYGSDGEWLKVQILQHKGKKGIGFFVDTAARSATQKDTIEVSLLNEMGEKVGETLLPKSVLKLAGKTEINPRPTECLRVNILRDAWIFASYTKKEIPEKENTEKLSIEIGRDSNHPIQLSKVPKKVEGINWGQLNSTAKVFLPMPKVREIAELDSGSVIQILGENKSYFNVQVSSTKLKDTLFIDLNQFYDLNSRDTTTLILGTRDSIQSLGSIKKTNVQFNANRAFFGPGISRLVPVDIDLPLLIKKNSINRFNNYGELSQAIIKRTETHPKFFFEKGFSDGLVKLTSEELESIIAASWFMQGGEENFAFGLNLKTIASREANRNPEEYFFHKYVKQILNTYSNSIQSLSIFHDLIIQVEYMEPGLNGTTLRFKTLSYKIPLAILDQFKAEKFTLKELFSHIQIDHEGGSA